MPPKNPSENLRKNEWVPELPPPAEDFSAHAKLYNKELKQKRGLAEEGLILDLGKIEIKGTSGREFEVESLWIPANKSRPDELAGSSVRLLTIDKISRKLAALEEFKFSTYMNKAESPEDTKVITGNTDIITRFRDIGAGSATERALQVVLQNLSEKYTNQSLAKENKKTVIIQEAINGPMTLLTDTRMEFEDAEKNPNIDKNKLEELKKIAENQAEEYKRWQSIFGNKNKLGFTGDEDSMVQRVFEATGIPTQNSVKIDLQKYDLLMEKIRQTI
jgi:hypothetical protein